MVQKKGRMDDEKIEQMLSDLATIQKFEWLENECRRGAGMMKWKREKFRYVNVVLWAEGGISKKDDNVECMCL